MLAKVKSAGRTDVGKKRDSNQDQFIIADLNKSMLVQSTSLPLEAESRLYGMSHGKLFMVADGMGGHQGGNRASRMAIDILINQLLNSMHWFFRIEGDSPHREEGFIEDLKSLLKRAHEAIEKEALSEVDKKGMGTTLTMAYVVWPWMYVIHAGDSRCYLLRGRELKQLTRDHTISSQLMEKAGMTADEASKSPWSNVLYNALGAGAESVNPEVHKVALDAGDAIMLCSDGLYRHVRDSEFRDTLSTELDPDAACKSLVDLANFRGGFDNITCVIARFGTPEAAIPKTRSSADVTLERLVSETIVYKPDEVLELQKAAIQPTAEEPSQPIQDTIDFTPTNNSSGDINDTLDLAVSPLASELRKSADQRPPAVAQPKPAHQESQPEKADMAPSPPTVESPQSSETSIDKAGPDKAASDKAELSTDEFVIDAEVATGGPADHDHTAETQTSEPAPAPSLDATLVEPPQENATMVDDETPSAEPSIHDTLEFDPKDPNK